MDEVLRKNTLLCDMIEFPMSLSIKSSLRKKEGLGCLNDYMRSQQSHCWIKSMTG